MEQVNFLPASFLNQQARRRRRVRQVALMMVLGAALLGWWMVQARQTESLRAYAQTLNNSVTVARDQQTAVQQLRQEHAQLVHQITIQRELAVPIQTTQILATLGTLMPRTVALTNLGLISERPDPSPLTNAGTKKNRKADREPTLPVRRIRIGLTGIAPDDMTVAKLLSSLKDHALFSNVKMHYSRTVEKYGVIGRQFTIELDVDLNRRFESAQREGVAHAG